MFRKISIHSLPWSVQWQAAVDIPNCCCGHRLPNAFSEVGASSAADPPHHSRALIIVSTAVAERDVRRRGIDAGDRAVCSDRRGVTSACKKRQRQTDYWTSHGRRHWSPINGTVAVYIRCRSSSSSSTSSNLLRDTLVVRALPAMRHLGSLEAGGEQEMERWLMAVLIGCPYVKHRLPDNSCQNKI